MDSRLPEGFRVDGGDSRSEIHNTGIGVTAAVVLGIVAGLAMGMAIYSQVMASQAEREARMLEYYVLEMDAKLISSGIKKPEDSVADKLKEQRK